MCIYIYIRLVYAKFRYGTRGACHFLHGLTGGHDSEDPEVQVRPVKKIRKMVQHWPTIGG